MPDQKQADTAPTTGAVTTPGGIVVPAAPPVAPDHQQVHKPPVPMPPTMLPGEPQTGLPPGSVPPPPELRGQVVPQGGKAKGAGKDDGPGEGFVKIRWKEKIGGHEEAEEWADERRAHNLVGSGHAEIVDKA